KGGVGKTTTTINLAAQAAIKKRTLLIDVDPQSNLTAQFDDRFQEGGRGTTYDMFFSKEVEPVEVRDNLFLIPSGDLSGMEVHLQTQINREYLLKKAIERFKDEYEYIFIDCPPSLNIITINAICASDYVIIPVQADSFSMQGVTDMIEFINMLRNAGANSYITLLGILVTHYEDRLKISKNIMAEFDRNGWSDALFKTMIRTNTDIKGAQFEKKTIFEFNRKSHGANDYAKLGQEVLKKIKNLQLKAV
ncbi:MAG: ParA family protein, partial [Bacteroidota bacterium]